MKVPLSWLKEYVPVTVSVEELAHRLTMAGLEVAAIERVGGDWDRERVAVGRVTAVVPHPNADRLSLPTVDLGGGETWTVVCGAPNVAAGQKIAFAKEGARLFNAHSGKVETLKRAKIRGVESAGMVCSELELGLGEDHTGILVLPEDAPLGTPLADYLGDVVLDIEVTANRPDCLSVLGVAREVAALTGQRVTEPDLHYPEEGDPIEDQARVQVYDAELCPRYTASLVTGVKIGPSPRWMQDRLLRAGQRPISNVVDVTNYVMLEYGQPLHAFDFHPLHQGTIVVRQARPGETLVTIDGEERPLAPPMLLIADPERAVGLAGVMGGANTEMTEATTAVLLESANFHPTNNRRTARALGMRTEATLRFEKGLGPELPPIALRRATQLILRLAGGTAARGILDAYPGKRERSSIPLTSEKVRRVLGVELPPRQVEEVLTSLGFHCEGRGSGALQVDVPYWRTDVTLPEDLVEEVARVVGYDQIPATPISGAIPARRPQPARELREQVRDLLVACGMQEVITYSLVSRELLERLGPLGQYQRPEAVLAKIGGAPFPMKVANPMSREQEYLRPTLRASLLTTLAANLRRSPEEGLRLFEVARVYLPRRRDLPEEPEKALGLLAGTRHRLSWTTSEGEALDLSDAKGVVETVLGQLGLAATYHPATDPPLHPGRCAAIMAGETQVGVLGEVHPKVLERFDIAAERVALFELDLEALLAVRPYLARRYQPLPRFPGTLRDLALVVDREVPTGEVGRRIADHPLVAQATLFDVYEGERIPPGKRSLAYRILFRSPDRTLASEEVNQARDRILATLKQELGATLRA